MSATQRGTIALVASLILPGLLFIGPLSHWPAFTLWGFPSVWLIAIALSVVAARSLSKWCYIVTAVLSSVFLFLMYVLAALP